MRCLFIRRKKTRRRSRSGARAWDAPRLRQLGPSGGRRSREDWAAALGLGPSPLSLSRAGGGKGRRGLVPYRPGSILNVPFCGHRTHEVLTNSVIMLMCSRVNTFQLKCITLCARPLKKGGPRGIQGPGRSPQAGWARGGGDAGSVTEGCGDSLLFPAGQRPRGPGQPWPLPGLRAGRAWEALSCTEVVLPTARPPESRGTGRPHADPPSTRGSGQGPEGKGCGAAWDPSHSRIDLRSSQVAGTPSTWRILRGCAERTATRGGAVQQSGSTSIDKQFFASPFSTCREAGWDTCAKERIFLCFHGSFQKPLFPHRVVPPSATTLPRNLPPHPIRSLGICSSPGFTARSWPG